RTRQPCDEAELGMIVVYLPAIRKQGEDHTAAYAPQFRQQCFECAFINVLEYGKHRDDAERTVIDRQPALVAEREDLGAVHPVLLSQYPADAQMLALEFGADRAMAETVHEHCQRSHPAAEIQDRQILHTILGLQMRQQSL